MTALDQQESAVRRSGHAGATTSIAAAICTYNNAAMLAETLATLESQAVPPHVKWSLTIVDNNCTDETAEVVRGFIKRGRIAEMRLARERRQGLAHARRRAVLESHEELIAFVDDDCRLAPDWLARAAEFMDHHPRAGAVGGYVDLRWAREPEPVLRHYAHAFAAQDLGPQPMRLPDDEFTYLVGAGLLVRRSALEASGWVGRMMLPDRCGRRLSSGGDVEIVLRVRNAGHELWYNPAMRMEHVIPERRMNVEYLRRLQRAAGQTLPPLIAMGHRRTPTMRWRFRHFRRAASSLGRALRTRMTGRVERDADPRVDLALALGWTEGALAYLIRPRPAD